MKEIRVAAALLSCALLVACGSPLPVPLDDVAGHVQIDWVAVWALEVR